METFQLGSSSDDDDDDMYLNSVAKLNGTYIIIINIIVSNVFKLLIYGIP